MRKDIEIPKIEGISLAALPEYNEDFQEKSWYIYLINTTHELLEMAIIVSKAFGIKNNQHVKTGIFRHAFKEIPPQSAVKIELLSDEVLDLSNEFAVTFFVQNKMYEKNFLFQPNRINESAMCDLPIIQKKGCLLKG